MKIKVDFVSNSSSSSFVISFPYFDTRYLMELDDKDAQVKELVLEIMKSMKEKTVSYYDINDIVFDKKMDGKIAFDSRDLILKYLKDRDFVIEILDDGGLDQITFINIMSKQSMSRVVEYESKSESCEQ